MHIVTQPRKMIRMEAKELTVRQAEELLNAWGEQHNQLAFDRDEVVRIAHASGIGQSRIASLMGLSRGTVASILRQPKP